MPSKPRTVRDALLGIFRGIVIFQIIFVAIGIFLATQGRELGLEAATRLDSLRKVFESSTFIGVVACVTLARIRLNERFVRTAQDLLKITTLCLMVGELTVLMALVGLAKLHLGEFLIGAGLVLCADFLIILPAALKLLDLPAPEKS